LLIRPIGRSDEASGTILISNVDFANMGSFVAALDDVRF